MPRIPLRVSEETQEFFNRREENTMTFNFSSKGNSRNKILIVIDGQLDFTDRPESALPVPGGVFALAHTAEYIMRNASKIDAILATRDKHVPNHIAHAVRWVDREGNHPSGYTAITLAQIDAGDYRAADPALQMTQRKYVAGLEARREKTLMIWPSHCIAGTSGYELDPVLVDACAFWENQTGKQVVYLDKGEHPDTEQYGAFAADVPVPGAPETFINMPVVNWVNSFGTKIWTGLALTHCVMSTMQQAFDETALTDRPSNILFADCTASVPGFEPVAEAWLTKQCAAGLRVQSSVEDWEE